MTWSWRWPAVGAVLALLIAAPAIVGALPADGGRTSAASLLRMAQNSAGTPYSGYAEADGGLSLPVTDQFNSIADILGGQTQLRVWWRGTADWRVDAITATGETDQHLQAQQMWTWDYESNTATQLVDAAPPAVRLPDDGDVLPPALARRLLSEATADEVSRIGARRVAGRSAPGIRLTPAEPGSTIDAVDVWVDPRSGVPLRVDVRGAGAEVISSQFLDFSSNRPSALDTAFSPPPGARVRTAQDPDLLPLIRGLGIGAPPATLAGVARNPNLAQVGAIGVYGSGVTEFAALPLTGRTARSLRDQLAKTADVSSTDIGQAVGVGPLSLVLTAPGEPNPSPGRGGGAWLLTGTVTIDTLVRAAAQLTGRGP